MFPLTVNIASNNNKVHISNQFLIYQHNTYIHKIYTTAKQKQKALSKIFLQQQKMKIIDKPKQFKLPYNIQKRITTEYQQQPSLSYQKSKSTMNQVPNSYQMINSNSNILAGSRAVPSTLPISISIDKSRQKYREKLKQKQKMLPQLYLCPLDKSRRAKSSFQYITNHITITYKKQNPNNLKFRQQIRRALSTKINFQQNNANHGKFLSQQLLNKVKQPIKAIEYNTEKFQFLFKNLIQIFGEDIQIADKDILTAYGIITQSHYIFFTAAYHYPVSLCCKSLIYLKVQEDNIYPFKRYAKKQLNHHIFFSGDDNETDNSIVTKFICSKCSQVVLIVRCKSSKSTQHLRNIGKDSIHFQAERQKINMSIIVASGKFKRMRIDQASQKDITMDEINYFKHNMRYNREDDSMLKGKGKTLVLKNILNRQVL